MTEPIVEEEKKTITEEEEKSITEEEQKLITEEEEEEEITSYTIIQQQGTILSSGRLFEAESDASQLRNAFSGMG